MADTNVNFVSCAETGQSGVEIKLLGGASIVLVCKTETKANLLHLAIEGCVENILHEQGAAQ